jgi:hypothetical protein
MKESSEMATPSFCWWCNKKLGAHHQNRNTLSFAIVSDPIGNEHRIHRICQKEAIAKGNKLIDGNAREIIEQQPGLVELVDTGDLKSPA